MLDGVARQNHDAVIGGQLALDEVLSDCLRPAKRLTIRNGAPWPATGQPLLQKWPLWKCRCLLDKQVCDRARFCSDGMPRLQQNTAVTAVSAEISGPLIGQYLK